jgi:ADP-ribose pyrophosphatase YjhB (NUDIX family)
MWLHRALSKVWQLLGGAIQWRLLRFFNPTFLVSVSAVVTRNGHDVLLLRHRYWPKDSWGLPGGYLTPRETAEEALRRELHEETRLDVEIERLMSVRTGFRFRIEMNFLARATDGDLQVDGNEALAAEFFDTDRLPATLMPTHHDLIRQAFDQKIPASDELSRAES